MDGIRVVEDGKVSSKVWVFELLWGRRFVRILGCGNRFLLCLILRRVW